MKRGFKPGDHVTCIHRYYNSPYEVGKVYKVLKVIPQSDIYVEGVTVSVDRYNFRFAKPKEVPYLRAERAYFRLKVNDALGH